MFETVLITLTTMYLLCLRNLFQYLDLALWFKEIQNKVYRIILISCGSNFVWVIILFCVGYTGKARHWGNDAYYLSFKVCVLRSQCRSKLIKLDTVLIFAFAGISCYDGIA